jgi:hypothetical protein
MFNGLNQRSEQSVLVSIRTVQTVSEQYGYGPLKGGRTVPFNRRSVLNGLFWSEGQPHGNESRSIAGGNPPDLFADSINVVGS